VSKEQTRGVMKSIPARRILALGRAILPMWVKSSLRFFVYPFLFSDWTSVYRYLWTTLKTPRSTKSITPVELRIRSLAGSSMAIRPGTTDGRVVYNAFFGQYHLPPREVRERLIRKPGLILDLGCNIGCTLAHFLTLFSSANVIGVELDAENAALCRENVARYGSRCRLIEGAVWIEDGWVEYTRSPGREEDLSIGRFLGPGTGNRKTGGIRRTSEDRAVVVTQAISLNTLISNLPSDSLVDYVKMDVEGAEKRLLRSNAEWTRRVSCLKVELHDYPPSDCISDLARLGFTAWKDGWHPHCVVGIRTVRDG